VSPFFPPLFCPLPHYCSASFSGPRVSALFPPSDRPGLRTHPPLVFPRARDKWLFFDNFTWPLCIVCTAFSPPPFEQGCSPRREFLRLPTSMVGFYPVVAPLGIVRRYVSSPPFPAFNPCILGLCWLSFFFSNFCARLAPTLFFGI